jgi:uncharacterized repeat protein (TIGR03943 family)
MTVDARTARGGVLGAWGLLYLILWLTNGSDRYLGSRTDWVVPFGAVLLAVAGITYAVASARGRRHTSTLTFRESLGLAALVVPLAAVIVVPHAALGSFAAGRKAGSSFLPVVASPPATPADVSFLDIRVANGDATFAREAGIHSGLRVRLLGLVTGRDDVPPGTFELARFYVGCCVADALPVGVPVDPGMAGRSSYQRDSWLTVTGTLRRRGGRFVVNADRISHALQPEHPYLSFRT